MIKSEHGKVELSGKGKEIIMDFSDIVLALFNSKLINDKLYCDIGAMLSTINDFKLGKIKSEEIRIDLDELKKQMGGNDK